MHPPCLQCSYVHVARAHTPPYPYSCCLTELLCRRHVSRALSQHPHAADNNHVTPSHHCLALASRTWCGVLVLRLMYTLRHDLTAPTCSCSHSTRGLSCTCHPSTPVGSVVHVMHLSCTRWYSVSMILQYDMRCARHFGMLIVATPGFHVFTPYFVWFYPPWIPDSFCVLSRDHLPMH